MLEAAYLVAGSRGLEALTVSEIERAAHVPHGSLRYHWGTLSALVAAMEGHHAARWSVDLSHAAAHCMAVPAYRTRLQMMSEAVLVGPRGLQREQHLRLLGDLDARAGKGVPVWAPLVGVYLAAALAGQVSAETARILGWSWCAQLATYVRDPGISLDQLHQLLVAVGEGIRPENA